MVVLAVAARRAGGISALGATLKMVLMMGTVRDAGDEKVRERILYQRGRRECLCFDQVTWIAAGGMAHLTFILMEGRARISIDYYYYYYRRPSKITTTYPIEIQSCFYDGAL
jgi:hypothetical protein